ASAVLRPPTSTLVPYTTLFRSELRDRREASWSTSDFALRARADLDLHRAIVAATHNPLYLQLYSSMLEVFAVHMHDDEIGDEERSEEHTSELQSRENLVCRLLL